MPHSIINLQLTGTQVFFGNVRRRSLQVLTFKLPQLVFTIINRCVIGSWTSPVTNRKMAFKCYLIIGLVCIMCISNGRTASTPGTTSLPTNPSHTNTDASTSQNTATGSSSQQSTSSVSPTKTTAKAGTKPLYTHGALCAASVLFVATRIIV
ncbi:hypothetical protein ScPMuIL_007576 [Solemya velum]